LNWRLGADPALPVPAPTLPPLQHHVWQVAGRIAGGMHRVVGEHQVELMEHLVADANVLADHVPKD
jgi:hypothetical protein